MAEPLDRGQLKAVVVTVLASGELGHWAETWIGCLLVGKWRKTAMAYSLVAVHLREIGLIYSARADVSRLQTGCRSELMFNSETPLHEVRRMQFAIGHFCYRDGWKTSCGICLGGCTRQLTLRKPHSKSLICSHDCVHRAVWHSGRNGCAADGAKQSSLKRLNVGWIGSDQIGNAARH